MSAKHIQAAWEYQLAPNEKLLFVYLCYQADEKKGGLVLADPAKIIHETGMSKPTFYRWIDSLRERGLVEDITYQNRKTFRVCLYL